MRYIWPADLLFVHKLNQADIYPIIKATGYWSFFMRNQSVLPVLSPHKESAMRKMSPCHEVMMHRYRKTSNIRRTLVGNKIVDHSDVVGASPVGAAPTTSSFST